MNLNYNMKYCQSLVFLLILIATSDVVAQLSFTEASNTYQVHNNYWGAFGGGVSFADFNGDHLDDITYATPYGFPLKMLQNTGSGFIEIVPPVQDSSQVKCVNWVDIDNDGDRDLYLNIYDAPCRLFRNDGNMTFTEITSASGIDINTSVFGSNWGDINNDGYVDLFVCVRGVYEPSKLFLNNGDLTFTDISDAAGIEDPNDLALAAVMFDFDNDNDLDIHISNDKYITQNKLFENDGTGIFTDVSIAAGIDIWEDAMSSTIGDYNHDGYFDLFVSNGNQGNYFFRNNTDGTFTNIAATNGTELFGICWSAQLFDPDNDTDLDLYISTQVNQVNYIPSSLLENNGANNFTVPSSIGLDGDSLDSYSNAIGDFNNDGFIDFVNTTLSDPSLFFENNGNSNHWLKVDLEGTISNRDGIGSKIMATAGGVNYYNFTNCGESYLSQNSYSEFFGLGTNTIVDSLTVLWPSGHTDVFYNVAADQHLFITEGETAPIDVTLSIQQPTSCMDSTLQISGNPQFEFQWSNGETTNVISVTNGGQYFATVTNVFGFSANTATITANIQWPLATVSVSTINASCINSTDGEITVTVNSTASGNVSWSNGSTGSTLSNVGIGWYTYTATDQLGCQVTDSALIVSPPAMSFSVLSNDEVNGNDGSASVFTWGGTSPYTYLWSDPLGQNGTTATGLSGGIYTVWITDANNCVDSVEVTINSSLGLIESNSEILIQPNPATDYFTIQSSQNLEAVRIYAGNGALIAEWYQPESNTFNISALAPGIYLVESVFEDTVSLKKLLKSSVP